MDITPFEKERDRFMNEQRKLEFRSIAMYLILLSGLGFLLWRAKFGFCFNDEPFCVTLAQRIFQGDALIADEWHGTQNFGPVILPLYMLFRLFSSSNEGILLFLRYTYCLLWWATCVIVYKTVSKEFKGGIIAFAYLILFSPLDYMTVSYTSVGLMSVLLLSCFVYNLPTEKQANTLTKTVAFSVLWIVATLCSPFMAAAYVFILLLAAAGTYAERKLERGGLFQNLFAPAKGSVLLIGVIAVIYLWVFALSRAELAQILESIPYVLSDPEHSSINLLESLIDIPWYVYQNFPAFCLVCAAAFVCGFVPKCKKIRLALFGVCTAMFVYEQFTMDIWNLNTQMLNIVILGAVAFALLEKKPYKLFLVFYGFGGIYTILNNIASNTELMATSMSLSVAGVAGILCIVALLKELLEQYREQKIAKLLAVAIISIALATQIGSEVAVRLYRTYWDKPMNELTETIEYGAAKGLITTPDRAQGYETTYKNLTYLLEQTETEGKTFLSCTSAPYIYLDADLDFATFSAWSFGYGEDLSSRILDYQKLHSGEKPDIIFCGSEEDILPMIDESYTPVEYNGAYLYVLNS